jgi:hypothetical protein
MPDLDKTLRMIRSYRAKLEAEPPRDTLDLEVLRQAELDALGEVITDLEVLLVIQGRAP